MKTPAFVIVIAMVGLVGCHLAKQHEHRTLAVSDFSTLTQNGCRITVWDLGEEFARLDRRAWATMECPESVLVQGTIEDGSFYRGQSNIIWFTDLPHADHPPMIKWRRDAR